MAINKGDDWRTHLVIDVVANEQVEVYFTLDNHIIMRYSHMKSEIIEHAKVLEKKYEDKKIDYKQIIDAYELLNKRFYYNTDSSMAK